MACYKEEELENVVGLDFSKVFKAYEPETEPKEGILPLPTQALA
jgi:hypothetical protein